MVDSVLVMDVYVPIASANWRAWRGLVRSCKGLYRLLICYRERNIKMSVSLFGIVDKHGFDSYKILPNGAKHGRNIRGYHTKSTAEIWAIRNWRFGLAHGEFVEFGYSRVECYSWYHRGVLLAKYTDDPFTVLPTITYQLAINYEAIKTSADPRELQIEYEQVSRAVFIATLRVNEGADSYWFSHLEEP
ncbi:hypothetical protein F-LCD7_0492 [Faustovirus]|nr:hypothetical protein F-LCD7_0492 [Faustovirus]